MAEEGSGGGRRSFTERIVSDPRNPPQTLLLAGYRGAAADEGNTRIYFDAELSDYVDVADDDILHSEPPGPRASRLEPELFWLKRDAQMLHGAAGGAQRATFFEGRIMKEFAARTPGAASAAALPHPTWICGPSQLVACPPSLHVVCPSHWIPCGHPTHFGGCITTSPGCEPTGIVGCYPSSHCPSGAACGMGGGGNNPPF